MRPKGITTGCGAENRAHSCQAFPAMRRGRPLRRICLPLALLLLLAAGASAGPPRQLIVATFASAPLKEGLPEGWQPQSFPSRERHTRYDRVQDNSKPALRAVSESSASALIRKIPIDPMQLPWICWRWKVTDPIQGENLRKKEGDDYAARIYITFAVDPAELTLVEKMKRSLASALYGEDLPYHALNYIWSLREPAGTMAPNPYTERSMMIVATEGTGRVGSWISVRRNIVEDYRRAFGQDPPEISGIAVMTDSDDTGESATAYYGDIVLSSEAPTCP